MRTPDPYINEAVEQGRYFEIYEYCKGKEDLESIYWQSISLMWMGRKVECEALHLKYDWYVMNSDSDFWKARYLMSRGIFHWGHEIYNAQDYFDRSFEISQHGDDIETIADYYIYSAIISQDTKFKAKYFAKGKKISRKIGYTLGIYWCNIFEVSQLRKKGKHEEADRLQLEQIAMFEGKNEFWYALALGTKGGMKWRQGNLEEAIEVYQKANSLAHKVHNGWEIANSYWNLSAIFRIRGDLMNANMYADKAAEQEMRMNHKSRIADAFWGKAGILEMMGDFHGAMALYQQALDIHAKEEEISNEIIRDIQAIARIHLQNQNITEAVSILLESIEMAEKLDLPHYKVNALTQLVRIHSANNRDLATQFLETLLNLREEAPDDRYREQYILSQAIYLKSSNRFKDKFKSQELFEDLKDKWLENGQSTLELDIHLVELLLIEYESTNETASYVEIERLLSSLLEDAQKNNRYPIFVQIKLLQSQMIQVQGDIERARSEMEDLLAFTMRKEFTDLSSRVRAAINMLDSKYESIVTMVNSNTSLVEMMKQTKISQYIQDAQNMVHAIKI